jgi:hypothetical protein
MKFNLIQPEFPSRLRAEPDFQDFLRLRQDENKGDLHHEQQFQVSSKILAYYMGDECCVGHGKDLQLIRQKNS